MTPVLQEALKSLTTRVNLSTGLAHALDSDSAKEMFKILRDKGEVLNKFEIENWAVSNGWASRHAQQLASLAEKVGNGGRVQIKNKGRWKAGIYDLWQERASETDS